MTDRYAHQSALPDVEAADQARLAAARMRVVGAGGLRCHSGLRAWHASRRLHSRGDAQLALISPAGVTS